MKINTRVVYTLFSAIIIIAGTVAAIEYAKGNYRLTRGGFVQESGLLTVTSSPTGAQVAINGIGPITATDDTIYLEPGEYQLEITRDGYSPWRKQIRIEKQLVTGIHASLFPTTPTLTPLTTSGVENISPSPDGQKLIYYTSSASAQVRNGLYMLDLTGGSPLSFQRGPRQITDDTGIFDLKTAQIIWSPDSSEILLVSPTRSVRLPLDRKSELETVPDVSFQQRTILSTWEAEMYQREREFLARFPIEIVAVATDSAKNVYFAPDKLRLLYTASSSAYLAEELVPPVPAINSQPQTRQLEPGGIYVYDRKEDTNFFLGTENAILTAPEKFLLATDLFQRQALTFQSSPSAFTRLQATQSAQTAQSFASYHSPLFTNTFQWLPDSQHLIYTLDGKIHIKEYDNTNDRVVYAGPFADNFIYPWPDGSRLIILTTFSPDTPLNLYTIELK